MELLTRILILVIKGYVVPLSNIKKGLFSHTVIDLSTHKSFTLVVPEIHISGCAHLLKLSNRYILTPTTFLLIMLSHATFSVDMLIHTTFL